MMTPEPLDVLVRSGAAVVGSPASLTPRQFEALRHYAQTGNQRQAAHEMGVKYETYKNVMTLAYAGLGVAGAFDAFRVLGWLATPEDAPPVVRFVWRLVAA